MASCIIIYVVCGNMLTVKDTAARRTALNKVLFKAMHRVGTADETSEEPMDIFEEDMRWFYQGEFGEWHLFRVNPSKQCTLTNRDIEIDFSMKRNAFMEYRMDNCTFRLDFIEMIQINLTTGMKRPIKRERWSPPPPLAPPHWETDLPFQLIQLDGGTRECQDVVKQFAKTMPSARIRSIKRIQHFKLWESFCRKKARLMEGNPNPIEERMLFHGTPNKNIRPICSSNFQLRFAGTNGSVLGKGIYFAKHAKYSEPYCGIPGEQDGILPPRTMILARVLVGEYTFGLPRLTQAPSKDRTSSYNSCVDNLMHPNIFVVFNSDQVYPEYLIEF